MVLGAEDHPVQRRVACDVCGTEIISVDFGDCPDAAQRLYAELIEFLPPEDFIYLPRSGACACANEAIAKLELAGAVTSQHLIELQVVDKAKESHLDQAGTLLAANKLIEAGYRVIAHCTDAPGFAAALEACGCSACVMHTDKTDARDSDWSFRLARIIEQRCIPILLNADNWQASELVLGMEAGCAGICTDFPIAGSTVAGSALRYLRKAVDVGREGYLASLTHTNCSAKTS